MKKLTYKELYEAIRKHNEEHNITCQYEDENPLWCVIVFKNESWPTRKKDYSLEGRSYKFRSDEKFFLPNMGGNSIFAETLDGSDACKLNNYLGEWIIDYCYIIEKEEKPVEKNAKFIRTKSGDIWELVGDVYRKPGISNIVSPDSDTIIDKEDEMYRLVKPGDLVFFMCGTGRIIEEKDMIHSEDIATGIKDEKACISSFLKIKSIYTTYNGRQYTIQARNQNGLWIVE